MSHTTEVGRNTARARTGTLRLVAVACFGIPVLLMCSCAIKPVKQYTLASQGALRPNDEATFRATEKPAFKPYVKIDGHPFSVGSEVEDAWVYGFMHPFAEPQMRSLEVRLLPGHHKVEVAIDYMGQWSLPFSKGRTITFEAVAGKTYQLQFKIIKFNDFEATGNIDWGTKIIEVDTGKEFVPDQSAPVQQAKT